MWLLEGGGDPKSNRRERRYVELLGILHCWRWLGLGRRVTESKICTYLYRMYFLFISVACVALNTSCSLVILPSPAVLKTHWHRAEDTEFDDLSLSGDRLRVTLSHTNTRIIKLTSNSALLSRGPRRRYQDLVS